MDLDKKQRADNGEQDASVTSRSQGGTARLITRQSGRREGIQLGTEKVRSSNDWQRRRTENPTGKD